MGAGREPIATLDALVEEAYALFKAPRPLVHGCCVGCCMYEDVEARFLDWPVREIPLDDIRDWYFAAADIPFPRPTIKWILPRLLELLARGHELAPVGNEVILQRLRNSGFPEDWPAPAPEFMARYAAALAEAVARAPEHMQPTSLPGPTLDQTLCMFGNGGIDLAPAIAALDALPTEMLVAALERDWEWTYDRVPVNTFWDSGPAKDLVLGWYTSDAMLNRMIRYGTESPEDSPGRDLALHVAEAILQWRADMGES